MGVLLFKGTSRSWINGAAGTAWSSIQWSAKSYPWGGTTPGTRTGWGQLAGKGKTWRLWWTSGAWYNNVPLLQRRQMVSCLQHVLVPGAVAAQVQDFPLLNFLRFLSAHISSLSKFLWVAAQPSDLLFLPVTKTWVCFLKLCWTLNLRDQKAREVTKSTLLWLALKQIPTQYAGCVV